jgi:molecular chaperone DnaK
MNDAKKFETDDKKKRDEIELRNQADMAVFSAEKMLKENTDKLELEDKTKIEQGIEAVKKALSGDNLDEVKKAMDSLTEGVYAATTKLYQKVQAEQAAKQQTAGASSSSDTNEKKQDDNVVNADYKVKEE